MTILISSCSLFNNEKLEVSGVQEGKGKVDGVDLCVSGVTTFELTPEEKRILRRVVKENVAQVNCLLHRKCGHVIPHPEICPR